MSLSGSFARIVAVIGTAAILWRRLQGGAHEPAVGSTPAIPPAKPHAPHPDTQDAEGPGVGPRADAGCGARGDGGALAIAPGSIRAKSVPSLPHINPEP